MTGGDGDNFRDISAEKWTFRIFQKFKKIFYSEPWVTAPPLLNTWQIFIFTDISINYSKKYLQNSNLFKNHKCWMVFNECHLNSNNLNWKYWQSKCHIKFIEQQWIDSIKALNAAKYSVTTWNFFLSLEFFFR